MARVRIRKARANETPGYYNKAAMFLKKAQDGTEVQSESADPGMMQDQGQSMLQAYYAYAYDQLTNDVPVDDVYGELVRKGLPNQLAYKLVNSLVEELVDRGMMNPDYKRVKEEEGSQEQQPQAEGNQTITDDWKENYGPNASSDQQEEDQSMYEEDEDAAAAEEEYIANDDHIMAMGGYYQEGGEEELVRDDTATEENPVLNQYTQVRDSKPEKFDFEELIQNTPGIQKSLNFPSLDEYIPQYAGAIWNNMDALGSSDAYAKKGGFVKKKDFVKNVMGLLKKQDGGEGQEQTKDKSQALGKGNPMDTLTEDVQKHKNNFLSALKEKATTVKTEEMYDKLMKSNDPELQKIAMQGNQQPMQPNAFQVGGYTGGENPLSKFIGGGMEEDPPYYEADFLPEAKYGYSTGNLIRAARGLSGPGGMNPDEFPQDKKEEEQPTPEVKVTPQVVVQTPEPMQYAKPSYYPQYGGYSGTWLRNLTPWNPLISRGVQQVGMNPYVDPLRGRTPIAREVKKRGLFGRPKQWTDYYSILGASTSSNGTKMLVADGNTLTFVDAKTGLPALPTGDFTYSNTDGLSLKSKYAIRKGEIEQRLNEERLKRHPELLEGLNTSYILEEDPIGDQARQAEREKYYSRFLENQQAPFDPYEGPLNPDVFPQGSAMTGFARGGALGRFIPQAGPGIVVDDPNLPRPAPGNPDLAMGAQPGMLGQVQQGPNSFWSQQASFNQPTPMDPAVQKYNNDPANNMVVEPEDNELSSCTPEQKRDTTSKCYCSPAARKDPNDKRCFESFSVDYQTTKTIDPEAMVNVANAGIRGVTGILNRRDQKRQERQMYDNLSSDNLYASQGTKHRGDWVDLGSMAGQYRFDQQGQDRSGFSSYGKYGGYMEFGGELDYLDSDDFPDED